MKILLIGECYSENLGDPLLCSAVEKSIKEHYPDASIAYLDLTGYVDFSTRYNLLPKGMPFRVALRTVNRFPWLLSSKIWPETIRVDIEKHLRVAFALNDILKEETFDVAVFAGGSIFMDYFAGVIAIAAKMLNRKGIKIIFHACGMSTLSEESAKLIQSALNCENVVSVSLRDFYARFMEVFQTSAVVTETYDTALSCASYYEPAKKKQAEFGIGVIEHPETPELYKFQKELIEQFLNSPYSWKIFTNGSRTDEECAVRILNELGIEKEVIPQYLTKRPCDVDGLIQTVSSFEKIVSFRMHSQIVASSYGIPNVGFVWDPKVRQFYEKMGFPKNAVMLNEYAGLDSILRKLEEMDSDVIKNKAHLCGMESQEELLHNMRCALKKEETI